MEVKLALINFVDILMRVPALFILDEALQSNLGDLGLYPSSLLPLHKEADFDFVTGNVNHTLTRPHRSVGNYDSAVFGNITQGHQSVIEYGVPIIGLSYFDELMNNSFAGYSLQILLLLSGTILSLFVMTLWTKHLVRIYELLFSVMLIFFSYQSNIQTYSSLRPLPTFSIHILLTLNLEELFQIIPKLIIYIFNIATQLVLVSGYLVINIGSSVNAVQGILALCFMIPSLTVILPIENQNVPFGGLLVASLHIAVVVLINLPKVISEVNERINYVVAVIQVEGLPNFVENEWSRLNIPMILRTFWMMRCASHLYVYCSSASWEELSGSNLITLLQIIMIRGCETLPAILGIASIFAWICSQTFRLCQHLLLIPNDEVSHVGPVSAVLFIILAFQNGLSALKPAARIVRLVRNISLLMACFLHFIHNAVDPVLMSLAASANPDRGRHVRALSFCLALSVSTFGGLIFLWSTYSVSTWLLAVTGFTIEVISKVFISLALYALFLADAKFNQFWDQLDDHVYRIKSFGRAIEFLVGLFLLCNSAFILIFESGGAIRAVLVGLHAYFNLWCEARAGWNVFNRRRTAAEKISVLETVTAFDDIDDVCAICFNELKPSSTNEAIVKVTPCRHHFHGVCLRKWLYVQDRCPMCHQILWPKTQTASEEDVHQQ